MQNRATQRKQRLAFNTASSLIFQVTSVACGLIVPRLILQTYGSEVNGLVNSIMQFLSAISFVELGIGTVVQSALYKPLAEDDDTKVSQIVVSAGKFFDTLARILLVYVLILVVAYPLFVKEAQNFGWFYTATLIAAISISSFAQYYFGVVDRLLLTADQRGYIQFNAQTITLIANTVACYVAINAGASIQTVKFVTSLIYLLRPVFLRYYIKRHYNVNRKITYGKEPIEQKWNGAAQHISYVVLDNTDSIVLTLFSTLANVSIYSVYFLVVAGIKQLFMVMATGFVSLLGELWARQEIDELNRTFGWVEWLVHTCVTVIFGCTAMLIVPFVMTYTAGITDVNYSQPLFGMLLVLANACHCLRLPYNMMILSAGHYRQTQSSFIIAMIINIVISVIAVRRAGLIGVTIGTLAAMAYQTTWMAWYDSRNIIKWPLRNVAKQFLTDLIIVLIAGYVSSPFTVSGVGYVPWMILAVKVVFVWVLVALVVNAIMYRDRLARFLNTISGRLLKRS